MLFWYVMNHQKVILAQYCKLFIIFKTRNCFGNGYPASNTDITQIPSLVAGCGFGDEDEPRQSSATGGTA